MELTLLHKTKVCNENYNDGPDYATITLTDSHIKRILQLHELVVQLDCSSIEDYDTTPQYQTVDWEVCEDEDNPKEGDLTGWTGRTECNRLVVHKYFFHYESLLKNTEIAFVTDGLSIEDLKQKTSITSLPT